MLHDAQAAPGTRAIRDKHLGLAEGDHDNEGDGHPRTILVTGSMPAAQRFSDVPQAVMRDSAVALGAAALIVVSRAKRSLSEFVDDGTSHGIGRVRDLPAPSSRVRRMNPYRTADRHGQSRAENIILSESFYFLRRHWQSSCIFLSTGCDGTPEREQRARIDRLKKHVSIYQRRAGLPKSYYVDVRESTPEPHAHIVAAFPSKAAALDFGNRLECSPAYGAWICGSPDAWMLVDDWRGLQNYLSKEATPQAWHGAGRSFTRIPVSERSGSISGDRVRLSNALERELVALGRIEPRTRTYAARSPVPAVAKPIAEFCEALNITDLTREANLRPPPIAGEATSAAGFPDTQKAGFCEATPEIRDQYAPAREAGYLGEQLALPLGAPVIDFAAMAEAKRKDLGLSQREAARMLGIRQPHWSNSINRRHDTLSPWARNRLREWVADRLAA